MIRSIVLSAVGCIALVSPALAADIYTGGPSYKDVPAYVPVSTWTGFYLGVNGGYGGYSGLGLRETTFSIAAPSVPINNVIGATDISGGFGGGQVGYNFQAGNFVYGIEADIEGSGIRGRGAQASITPGVGFGGTSSIDVNYFGTVRGRIGYSLGSTLLYATGGFAYGGLDTTYTYNDTFGTRGRVSDNSTRTGWTAGAGIEVKLSPSWTLKGEYQFIDLEPNSVAGPLTLPLGYDLRGKSELEFNTVRVGVNYLFNAAYEPLPLK